MNHFEGLAIILLILLGIALVIKWQSDRQMERLMDQLNKISVSAQEVIRKAEEDRKNVMQMPGKADRH